MAYPKSGLWWVLWVHVCSWFVLSPKKFKLQINQLVVWFLQVRVSNWCLSFFPIPIPKLQHALLPPKCYKPGNVPQLFTLPLSSPHTHIWVYQGAWERIINVILPIFVYMKSIPFWFFCFKCIFLPSFISFKFFFLVVTTKGALKACIWALKT